MCKDKKFCKGCYADVTDTMYCYCGEFYLNEASVLTEDQLPESLKSSVANDEFGNKIIKHS